MFFDFRVGLPALRLVERRDVRVGVGQVGDQAQGNLVVLDVVEESATRRAGFGERPASGVDHQAFLMLGRIDVPQLLDAEAIVLWIFAFAQVEFFLQLLAQVATATFRKDGVLGVKLHARGVAGFMLAIMADTGIAGGDTFNRAIFIV